MEHQLRRGGPPPAGDRRGGREAAVQHCAEAAKYLADRDIESIAKTTVFNCRPDALCVSGATAGSATDPETLRRAKSAVGDTVVFANTGCRVNTIENLLSIADGAVVGTTFKYDGKFENQVDVRRVKEFMDKVHSFPVSAAAAKRQRPASQIVLRSGRFLS